MWQAGSRRGRPAGGQRADDLQLPRLPGQAHPTERGPIWVRTVRRVHHDTETDVSQPERDETIETREYSDGFGRLVQTRAQAEDVIFGDPVFGGGILPADQSDEQATRQPVVGKLNADRQNPNVVVSGWQIYNNKGRVVEKYEPFFSVGWDYAAPTDAQAWTAR